MSDFDKEAEREKLREKYERDKQERKATQRMSDLLLKGATMTNTHCGTCGDPLFQMDGTTFCPSCHGNPDAVEGTELEAQPAEEQSDTDQSAGSEAATNQAPADRDETPSTEPSPDSVSSDSDTETAASTQRGAPATPPQGDRQSTPRSDAGSSRTDGSTQAAEGRTRDSSAPSRASVSSPQPVDGDLEAARDALVRALEKFATEAAATDDPRYARECLEAAREAGEALSTVR